MNAPRHDRAYLVTLRTLDGRPALAGSHAALFCRVLASSRRRLGFSLRAFVVLPDCARMVLATRDGDPRSVAAIAQRFRARFARELHALHGWPGRVFRDETNMALIEGEAAVARRAEVLHRAPVTAGLARHPRGWAWSSWRAWEGTGSAPIPVDPPPAARQGAGAGPRTISG